MDIVKLLSNPIRIRVMQYLQTYGEATTKQISEALKDISIPTLYRHINVMVKEEILLIKEERKVRGSLERLLAINNEKMSSTVHSNIADTSYKFLMELYMRFQKYSCNVDADLKKDRISLTTCILKLTDDSFDDFINEIIKVTEKYQVTEENGKIRSVSFISAPGVEEEKQN